MLTRERERAVPSEHYPYQVRGEFSKSGAKIYTKKAKVKTFAKRGTKGCKSSTILEGSVRIMKKTEGVSARKPAFFSGTCFFVKPSPATKEIIKMCRWDVIARTGIQHFVNFVEWDFVFFFHYLFTISRFNEVAISRRWIGIASGLDRG